MLASALLALAATLSTAAAQYKGFNYGSAFTDGTAKQQSDFEAEFTTAQALVGTSGFASARLYTMIQAGTANSLISAIPAAIATKTTLLLGLWASAGQANFDNELAALTAAIQQHGQELIDLIAGISVGSEDLYRISPTGIENMSGAGAEPVDLISYISQVRTLIEGTALKNAPVGHVDTWTAYVNGSNYPLISACDFLGMDAYPYFQTTMFNDISNAKDLFFDALGQTQAAAQGKPVWVTETGWPVSGPTGQLAVPGLDNAKTYWDEIGCSLFGTTNTWWYTLQDAAPTTPSPSFGIVGTTLSTTPLFDLTCPAAGASSSSSAASSAATVASVSSVAPPAADSGSAASQAISNAPLPGASYDATATAGTGSAAASSAAASTSAVSSAVASTSAVSSAAASTSAVSSAAASTAAASAAASSANTVNSYVTSGVGSGAASATSTVYASESSLTGAAASSAASAISEDETTTIMMTEYSTNCPPVVITSTIIMESDTTFATMTSKPTATAQASESACPANLSGDYQYPHLIVPVDSSQPDKAFGTSYNGTVSKTISSVFQFDIPQSYAGKQCSLIFLLPKMSDLETSAYSLSGTGGLNVYPLAQPINQQATYNNLPAKEATYGVPSVTPGSTYVVASNECPAGKTATFEVSSTGDLALNFFQDYNPSPLGFYITAC